MFEFFTSLVGMVIMIMTVGITLIVLFLLTMTAAELFRRWIVKCDRKADQ